MPRYQLIKIIEMTTTITSKDIDEAYEQYRYGLKPGFTLFCINGKCKKLNANELEKGINEQLLYIKDGNEDKYKSLKYRDKVKIEENVYEFCFTYLSKYSYISEEEEPKFIYELNECFVWIGTSDKFIAIKNAPNKVISILQRILTNLYDTSISNVKLTQKLIDEIFGRNKMIKGTYYNPVAGKDEAQKITVSDPELSEKESVRERLKVYDTTSLNLNEDIDDNTKSSLGINCNKGKLYITKNVSASLFRSWSVKRIKDIINYLKQIDNSKDYDIFKAKNIMNNDIWNSLKLNSHQRVVIEEIVFSLFKCITNEIDSTIIESSNKHIFENLFNSFYYRLSFECELCNETSFAFCPSCREYKMELSKNGSLFCKQCGKVQNNSYSLQCEEGHENSFGNINEFTVLIPTGIFIGKIGETLNNYFQIKLDSFIESFYIYNNDIVLVKKKTEGEYISPEKIPELVSVENRKLSEDKYISLLSEFDNIKEKCSKMNNKNCNTCILSSNKNCIMKIFTVFDGFRPSPHHGQEFGDVSFEVTYKNQKIELVGIAKSRQKNSETLNLSDGSARELIQQFFSMTHDKRVGIISAVCPMRFHEQLSQELKYIAKVTGTKMTIFDDFFMAKLLDFYKEKKTNGEK